VQGAPAEAIVCRIVVRAVARHCLRGFVESRLGRRG
jgi:hypothetical protein